MALRFEKTDEKVTREMAARNTLLFLPENQRESIYVQERLFEMGFIWAGGGGATPATDDVCVTNGIVLKGQRIYYLGAQDKAEGYKLCRLEQLSPDYVSPEEASLPPRDMLIEMFAEVSNRLAAMERRMENMEKQLAPQGLDKPAGAKPAAASLRRPS